MPHQFYDCAVTQIINESDIVKRFFIQLSKDIPFHFIPGQFVMLDLPMDHTVVDRAYSIASPPSADGVIELAVALKPGGAGSTYLFTGVYEGSTIRVSKPLGKFSLPHQLTDDLCFVCTGTGIAPLRSMLHHIFNTGIVHQRIYLVFGNRWEKDILYHKEMNDLQQAHPEFSFLPVLSRADASWRGKKGYVHDVYEELFADRRPAIFYLCGWKEMIAEARTRIAAMGYDKSRIKFEKYD